MSAFQIDDEDISKFGDVVATELLSQLRNSIDFMAAFCPIGTVVPIMVGLPGVPEPNPHIFQECDGSEITNPNSPLRSQGGSPRFVPNMIDRYIRVPLNFGLAGNPGGYNTTLQFRHNHGGRTNVVGVGGAIKGGYNNRTARPHSHAINMAFPNPVNVEPPYCTVKFYMRIQ